MKITNWFRTAVVALTFLSISANAGLITERWTATITSVSGDYLTKNINEQLTLILTFDDSSLRKHNFYSDGTIENEFCAGSASFSSGCDYSFTSYSIFADIENATDDGFDRDTLFDEEGYLSYNTSSFHSWFSQGASSHLDFYTREFHLSGGTNRLGSIEYVYILPNQQRKASSYQFGAFTRSLVTSVPEPSTLAIFVLGIMGLASRRYKKQ